MKRSSLLRRSPLRKVSSKRQRELREYTKPLSEAQVASFWSRVDKSGSCWIWTKGKNGKDEKSAYGIVWFNGYRHKCHRLAFRLIKGPIPEGLLVCHTCDNPPCCNPAHLFVGTPKDNSDDARAKGRLHREMGSARYNAILTEEAVAEIKAGAPTRRYGWGRMMARKYGVCPTAINNVIRGRRWKQVPSA
jgi:hypothetical protein